MSKPIWNYAQHMQCLVHEYLNVSHDTYLLFKITLSTQMQHIEPLLFYLASDLCSRYTTLMKLLLWLV